MMPNTTQRFFDEGPDAICIADSQLTVQHVNAAFERIFGYTKAEIQGTPLWNLVESSRREAAERVLQAMPQEGAKRVWPFVAKGGKVISFAMHCVRSPSGSHLTTFREVGENREEDQKRLATERALMFLEHAPNPMYEIDGGGVVTLWNRAMTNLFGISAAEAIGKRSLDVLASDMTTEDTLRIMHDLNVSGSAHYSGIHERRNGPPIHCVWTYARMHDDTGKTLGVAITGIDVTETLRKENELQSSLEIIKAQRDHLRALSTPILEVWEHVLALPVVGILDSDRAANMMQDLLSAISTRDCRFAILDLTGVASVDESSATHLVSILQAIALLGATGIVTGLRPATARTMVESGIDFNSVATFPTLQAGLRHCLSEVRRASKSTTRGKNASTGRS